MERRRLPALIDLANSLGAFATRWEGWKNPAQRASVERRSGRINVSHPDAIGEIDDDMGLYVALYEPSPGSRYVAYVGYSAKLRKELEIRYRRWELDGYLHPRRGLYPFAAFYLPNQQEARSYEYDLIRLYAPPWNTKYHR
jgi:hypothetical protein